MTAVAERGPQPAARVDAEGTQVVAAGRVLGVEAVSAAISSRREAMTFRSCSITRNILP